MLSSIRKHAIARCLRMLEGGAVCELQVNHRDECRGKKRGKKREEMKREYPEAGEQKRLVQWLRERDDCMVMRLENALKRTPMQAARDKAMGMEPGAPDLIIACRGRVIFWEMKAVGGKVSDEQAETHRVLRAMELIVGVGYGFDDSVRQLTELLA